MGAKILRIYKIITFFATIGALNKNSLISLENLRNSFSVVSLEFELTIIYRKFQITGPILYILNFLFQLHVSLLGFQVGCPNETIFFASLL